MLNLCKTLSKTQKKERNKLFIWKKVIEFFLFSMNHLKKIFPQNPITINTR